MMPTEAGNLFRLYIKLFPCWETILSSWLIGISNDTSGERDKVFLVSIVMDANLQRSLCYCRSKPISKNSDTNPDEFSTVKDIETMLKNGEEIK